MFSSTSLNSTFAEQHTLAPEAEELPELPSELEFEEEEGDRELSPNKEFNEAIAQIPDELPNQRRSKQGNHYDWILQAFIGSNKLSIMFC